MARRVASAVVVLVFLVVTATAGATQPERTDRQHRQQQASGDPGTFDFQGEQGGRHDVDNRGGAVAPTAARQRAAVAPGETVRFNRFGTAEMVTTSATGGFLAEGLSADPVEAARQW